MEVDPSIRFDFFRRSKWIKAKNLVSFNLVRSACDLFDLVPIFLILILDWGRLKKIEKMHRGIRLKKIKGHKILVSFDPLRSLKKILKIESDWQICFVLFQSSILLIFFESLHLGSLPNNFAISSCIDLLLKLIAR